METLQTAEATVGRAAYYRAEAERVWRLADAAGEGRERFQQVALEYRSLAYRLDPDGDVDLPLIVPEPELVLV